MANIPLADFPNAPAPAPVPALVQAPAPDINFEELDGLAGAILQNEISQGALDVYGQGVNQLARGIASLGELPMQVASKVAEARNLRDEMDVDNLLYDAFERHKADIQGLPESEYVPSFQKRAAELRKQIDDMPLAPAVRRKAELDYENFFQRGTTQFKTQAQLSLIQRSGDASLQAFRRKYDAGDYKGARAVLHRAEKAGVLGPGVVRREMKAKDEELIALGDRQEVATDPWKVLDEAKMAAKSGMFRMFGRTVTEEEARNFEIAAGETIRQRQFDAMVSLSAVVGSEKAVSRERIEAAAAEARLPREAVDAQIAGLTKIQPTSDPAGVAFVKENEAKMRAAVAAYDPTTDWEQDELYRLVHGINSGVLQEGRQGLLAELFGRRKQNAVTPKDMRRANLLRRINEDYARGDFGSWKTENREAVSYDYAAKAGIATRVLQAMDAAEEFLGKNPEATQAEIDKWHRSEFRARILTREISAMQSGAKVRRSS